MVRVPTYPTWWVSQLGPQNKKGQREWRAGVRPTLRWSLEVCRSVREHRCSSLTRGGRGVALLSTCHRRPTNLRPSTLPRAALLHLFSHSANVH